MNFILSLFLEVDKKYSIRKYIAFYRYLD